MFMVETVYVKSRSHIG